MKRTQFGKTLGAFALAIALGSGLAGCAAGEGVSGGLTDTSEGVAATVNGEELGEAAVTDYIDNFRRTSALEDDDAWGMWLAENGYTPASVRSEVIDYYVDQILRDQAAAEFGVSVTDEEVDAALENTKAAFETEEAFQESLTASGLTEERYRDEVLRPNVLYNKLTQAVSEQVGAVDDDQVLANVQAQMTDWDGAKRVSQIVFGTENEAEAEALAEAIAAGDTTFDETVEQYAAEGTALEAGDAGWDRLTTLPAAVQTAVDELAKDETSGLVRGDGGYYIVKVTDEFAAPAEGVTSLDQVPNEFIDRASESVQSAETSDFTTWFEEYRAKAEITVNEMPQGLPYDIDIAPYLEKVQEEQSGTVEPAALAEDTSAPSEAPEGEGEQSAEPVTEPSADEQSAGEDAASAEEGGQPADETSPDGGAAGTEPEA